LIVLAIDSRGVSNGDLRRSGIAGGVRTRSSTIIQCELASKAAAAVVITIRNLLISRKENDFAVGGGLKTGGLYCPVWQRA